MIYFCRLSRRFSSDVQKLRRDARSSVPNRGSPADGVSKRGAPAFAGAPFKRICGGAGQAEASSACAPPSAQFRPRSAAPPCAATARPPEPLCGRSRPAKRPPGSAATWPHPLQRHIVNDHLKKPANLPLMAMCSNCGSSCGTSRPGARSTAIIPCAPGPHLCHVVDRDFVPRALSTAAAGTHRDCGIHDPPSSPRNRRRSCPLLRLFVCGQFCNPCLRLPEAIEEHSGGSTTSASNSASLLGRYPQNASVATPRLAARCAAATPQAPSSGAPARPRPELSAKCSARCFSRDISPYNNII